MYSLFSGNSQRRPITVWLEKLQFCNITLQDVSTWLNILNANSNWKLGKVDEEVINEFYVPSDFKGKFWTDMEHLFWIINDGITGWILYSIGYHTYSITFGLKIT